MNKQYERNLNKQKNIEGKIESLQSDLEELRKEQENMENTQILKEYRSIDISIDEFLSIIRNHKKLKEKTVEKSTAKKESEISTYDINHQDKSKEEKFNEYK